MIPIGILGINDKTADLALREAMARGADRLRGERALFFPHPTILLSTCNRTEIYFSAEDLGQAHSDLLAYLRMQGGTLFEHRLYSYFGSDCFFHLCKVAAGLDSAIFAETEIQRQVRVAYADGQNLSSALHFLFQKGLKVSKEIRNRFSFQSDECTLYKTLWGLADWKGKSILLVGYSQINRGLVSFLRRKGVENVSLSTQGQNVQMEGVQVVGRDVLSKWSEYDVIVCASKAGRYLINGKSDRKRVIFDLSVPRNVDPTTEALIYNMESLNRIMQEKPLPTIENCEDYIWQRVLQLTKIYRFKTQRVPEIVGMGSHL